ncbi:MAG: hypothetical protein ACE5IL_14190 [Myxococcota bacterium]
MAEVWRRCSSCKRDIEVGQVYWVCNVSTCNRKRTGLVFCTTECWDAHLGVVNHRESWAIEKRAGEAAAPVSAARAASPARRATTAPSTPVRRRVRAIARPASAPDADRDLPRDILIVASKLKAYIRARSGMNTSDRVLEPLSDRVRQLCDGAIEQARAAERRTVLDRDF